MAGREDIFKTAMNQGHSAAWDQQWDKAASAYQKALDESYLAFLDQQIGLCPRGEEWNAVLRKRRQALTGFVGKVLLDGVVRVSGKSVFIKVDPEGKKVLYWEDWTG